MVLHQDDPNREGNLTDQQWQEATQKLIDEQGDKGLHAIPEDVLAVAVEAAKAQAKKKS